MGPRGGERPGDLPDATAATDALPTADVVARHAFEACKNGFDKLLVALSGLDGAVSATLQGVPTDISLASAVISSGDLLEFAGMTLEAMHKIKKYRISSRRRVGLKVDQHRTLSLGVAWRI